MKLFKNIYAHATNFSHVYKEDYKKQNIKFALVGYRFTRITAQLYVVLFGIPYGLGFSIGGRGALIVAPAVKPLNCRKGYIFWNHDIVKHYLYNNVQYSSTYEIKRKNMLTEQGFVNAIQQNQISAVCYSGAVHTISLLC